MKLPELEHRHTPSNRLHRWLDFFLHAGKLYNKKTGIGTCAICGQKIRYPQQYAVTLMGSVFHYSSFSSASTFLLCKYLQKVLPLNYWLVVGISVLFGAALFLLLRRYHTSFALSSNDWIEIPDGEEAKSEAIKQYKQDQSLVNQVECKGLIFGAFLFYFATKLS